MIKLTIEEAAKSKGIETQKELRELIIKKFDIEMRAATISDLYRDNKTTVNKEHLHTIMKALDITDFNEILSLSDKE